MIFAKLVGWCFRQTGSARFWYCIGKYSMTLPSSYDVHTRRCFVLYSYDWEGGEQEPNLLLSHTTSHFSTILHQSSSRRTSHPKPLMPNWSMPSSCVCTLLITNVAQRRIPKAKRAVRTHPLCAGKVLVQLRFKFNNLSQFS